MRSTEAQVILDASPELAIHKSTLFRKIKVLGIDLRDKKGKIHRRQIRSQ